MIPLVSYETFEQQVGNVAMNIETKCVSNLNDYFSCFLVFFIVLIDFGDSKPLFIIEEMLIVGIMFLAIYLRGFSVAID